MIQWVAVVVIILAVLEAVAYGCLRRRRRANGNTRQRGSRGEGGLRRSKREATDLAERLLSHFPSSPSAAQEPTLAEDACPICLDPLTDSPSLMMPCHHHIHAACLKNFVAHQLSRSNEVNCPMCRFAIVEEDAVEDDERSVSSEEPSDSDEDVRRGARGAEAETVPQHVQPLTHPSSTAAVRVTGRPRRTSSLLGRPPIHAATSNRTAVPHAPPVQQEYTAIAVDV